MKAHASSVATQDNYYGYDGLQQVTLHDRSELTPPRPPYIGITGTQLQEDFGCDELGNWKSLGTWTPSGTLAQPLPHSRHLSNKPGLPLDSSGLESCIFRRDAWNRLVKLTEGSSTITYAYDALTRRTTKTNSSETRHYYYDRQWRAVEERVAGASITVDRQYTWSPIDRWTLIRRKRTVTTSLDETRFVLKDYLDPAAIIDSSATVDERFGYDAFGQLNLMTPAFAARTISACDWNFLFHAEFIDSDSGLYNYGYRYYHTNLGRWLSRDPIGEQGGLNLYAFVGNRPSRTVDKYGLMPPTGWSPLDANPPSSPPQDPCPAKQKAMNNYLDKMAQGSTGTPDCSGENCEVISILINLGDPCGGYSETGHVGLGVGKDYYDTYPGGEHRYKDEEGVNMARIEKKYRTGQGTGSILIEFCMCKDGADFAREKMKSFLTEGLKPVQCTSAVCSALFGSPAILSGLENPRNFARKLTPQDVPFGGVLDNRPINQCGAEKGKRANVKIIQRPDRALDQ